MSEITPPIAAIDGPPPADFEEFWPYYVSQHLEDGTRTLHVAGTVLGLGVAAAALLRRKPARLLAAPVIGYGFAWIGHFFIEKNKPATFDYPGWSLRGDMRLLARTLSGRIAGDVDAVRSARAAGSVDAPRGEGEQAA